MRKTALFIITMIFLASCSPTVHYVGNSYSPSNHVDVYLSTADIKKSYTVMGKIIGQSVLFEDFDKIQEKIVAEAQKRGADAVLIYDMEEKTVATVQRTNQTTTGDDHKQWWSAATVGTTVTNNQEVKVMHADFLKYQNN